MSEPSPQPPAPTMKLAFYPQRSKNQAMFSRAKLPTTLAGLVLAATALVGCTTTATAPQAANPVPKTTESATPTPTYLTELPAWAQETRLWLIYPDGFECAGTEGCPNNYRATFGDPGPVLPEGVEYYDSAKHDCVLVAPAGKDCMG